MSLLDFINIFRQRVPAPGGSGGIPVEIVAGGGGGGGGDASAANQVTGNTSLAAINAKLPALGTAAKAAAVPVSLATDHPALPLPTGAATAANQSTANTSLSTIAGRLPAALGTGGGVKASIVDPGTLATAAKQDTGNGSLSSIDGKLPPLGPAAKAASVPVSIATDQSAVPVSDATLAAGLTPFSEDALGATPVDVVAGPAKLFSLSAFNTSGSAVWLLFYDAASGDVVPGVTAPRLKFYIPAGGSYDRAPAKGTTFTTAICAQAAANPDGSGDPAGTLIFQAEYL